jgi:mannose-6-phosphate isomerase-like protein (cupin superfamily)
MMRGVGRVAVVVGVGCSPFPLMPEAAMAQDEAPAWMHFDIDDIRSRREEHGRPWEEFIRVPDLFTGLYEIPAGGEDRQSPHDADEVYYILAGRATAVVAGDRIEVGPGSVLFVAKEEEHRFVDITDDLSVLVFFATGGGGGDGT